MPSPVHAALSQPSAPKNKDRSGKAYKPTPEQRALVESMAAFGIPEEEMVKLIINPSTKMAIAPKTLRKHYRVEIDRGVTNANVRVMNGMFKNATTPTAVHPGGNPILQIFWAKTRLRWRQDGSNAPGFPAEGGDQAPQHPDEVNLLEAARRLAFTITLGAREAAKEGPRPSAPAQSPKKAVRA